MQAIQSKYLGATNYKPSRIKAWCQAGSITMSYDHGLNIDENHLAVATALVNKLGWNDACYGGLAGGTLPSGDYCFVLTGNAWKAQ